MKKDDLKYLNGLADDDRQVFSELFDAYYEPLVRYCIRVVPDQDEAEEIVQETFVNLWEKRRELSIETSLNAYLYRIVMNKAINYNNHLKIRSKHKEQVMAVTGEAGLSGDELLEAELQTLYQTALDRMPEKRRKAFELSRKQGLKYSEIAENLAVSEKTVQAHISKALEDLRLHLKDYLPLIVVLISV
jgi:RNA polymerase sigma-70 factor, ECF subfamily